MAAGTDSSANQGSNRPHPQPGGVSAGDCFATVANRATTAFAARTATSKSLGRFARLRMELVLELLGILALTAGMLVKLGVFTRKRKANDRLKKWADTKRIKRIALVQMNDVGRPEY